METLQIIGISLIVVSGTVVLLSNGSGKWFIIGILFGVWGLSLLGVGVLYTQTTDLTRLQIEYKSIGVENERYYAIGEDGEIYTITQEQWASLDVPVIAQTK